MTDRIVTLRITKCGECPKRFVWSDDGYTVHRCDLAMMRIPDHKTIPTWCPLLKEGNEG